MEDLIRLIFIGEILFEIGVDMRDQYRLLSVAYHDDLRFGITALTMNKVKVFYGPSLWCPT